MPPDEKDRITKKQQKGAAFSKTRLLFVLFAKKSKWDLVKIMIFRRETAQGLSNAGKYGTIIIEDVPEALLWGDWSVANAWKPICMAELVGYTTWENKNNAQR